MRHRDLDQRSSELEEEKKTIDEMEEAVKKRNIDQHELREELEWEWERKTFTTEKEDLLDRRRAPENEYERLNRGSVEETEPRSETMHHTATSSDVARPLAQWSCMSLLTCLPSVLDFSKMKVSVSISV